jgi:hypothetical protein
MEEQGIEKLLDTFFNVLLPESGNSGLSAYVSYIIQYSYILAAILMVLLVGSKIAAYFGNPTKEIDPYILIKPILVLAALSLYQPLVDFLLFKPTDIIIEIAEDAAIHATNSNSQESFNKIFWDTTMILPQGNEEGDSASIWEIVGYSVFFEILHFLIFLLSAGVAAYIMVRQLLLKVFYFVLGVLVLPLSLIPGNEEILKKWFFGFLAILLWIPLLRIIQTIMILIHQVGVEEYVSGGGLQQVLIGVILKIVMIFFILSVPKYANILVSGSGDNDSNGWLVFIGREAYYKARAGSGKSSSSSEEKRRSGK